MRSSDDDNLFRCPFVHIEDAGTARFSDADVEQLREYLQKGGFMWSDDFWGDARVGNWEEQIGRVLPPGAIPIVDIPVDPHDVSDRLQREANPAGAGDQSVAPIGRRNSERGAKAREVNTRGIFDEKGRLMVLMTHNTDISDTWEREGEDVGVPLPLLAGRICDRHQRACCTR